MSDVVYLKDRRVLWNRDWGWGVKQEAGVDGEVGAGELEKLEKTSTSHLLLAHFGGLSTTDA